MFLLICTPSKIRSYLADSIYRIGHPLGILEQTSPLPPLYGIRAILLVNLYKDEGWIRSLQASAAPVPVFTLCDGACEEVPYSISLSLPVCEMLNKIESAISYPSPLRLGSYRYYGLDVSVGCAPTYLGHPIPLTGTEMRLLRYLCTLSPTPVGTHDILSHIFPDSRMPESACVRAHISSINKKFRRLFGHRAIGCMAGVGYRLTLPSA